MRTAKLATRVKIVHSIVSAIGAIFQRAEWEQLTSERIDHEIDKVYPADRRKRLTVADQEYIRGYRDGAFWSLYHRLRFTYRVDGKRIKVSDITDHSRVSEQNSGKYATSGVAYETADGLLPFHEFNRIADLPHIYTFHENGFRAEFYRGAYDHEGERWLLAYRIFDDMEGHAWGEPHQSSPLFYGRDLGLPCRTDISANYVREHIGDLLSWFSLTYGDTDRDYFEKYSARQNEFRESYRRDELANLVSETAG